MNINILRYSLFGIAGGQDVYHTFVKFIIQPSYKICIETLLFTYPLLLLKRQKDLFKYLNNLAKLLDYT